MIFLFLFACDEDPIDETTWSGYAYQKEVSGDMSLMESEDATLDLIALDGELLTSGVHPYDSSYWSLVIDDEWLGQDVAVRVTAPETDPMLWRGKAPMEDAIWLNQSIFGHSLGYNSNFFAQLSAFADIENLSESSNCHLWGQPLTPETWGNASIALFDGNGEAVQVFAWSINEQGILVEDISEKVDLFMAFNIAPGNVKLQVQSSEGMRAETVYPAQAGDLLSAFYYVLPTSND